MKHTVIMCGIVICSALLLIGCQPTTSQSLAQPLPTVARLDASQLPSLDSAASVAINFLENWRLDDFSAMYNLTSYVSQQTNTLEAFIGIYQTAAAEMTLSSLTYAPGTSVYRDPNRADIVVFNYNVTFSTRLLGEFSDTDRNLQVVYDERAADWRVAWTPGDIFAQMSGGGQLRRTLSVPSRANIYDNQGRVLADQSGRIVTVWAVKQSIPDWEQCKAVMAAAMRRDPETLQRTYDQSSPDWDVNWGVIEAQVYEQQHPQIEAACNATFRSRPTREYNHSTIAPWIVGSIGYPTAEELPEIEALGFNAESSLGRSGIEAAWDETLRGTPGGSLTIVSPGGEILREITRIPSQPAESVWLTINIELQTAVLEIVDRYYREYGLAENSRGAAVVLMDVNTGEVLAMVSYPTYDANAFVPFSPLGIQEAQRMIAELEADERRPVLNRPTQGVYALGSVMKTATSIAVADSGVYALDERYTCIGIWTRDITRVDWFPPGHGSVTLPQALERSCNPYYYEVGYQMDQFDPFALPDYIRRLGLGVPTGMVDIAESPGLIGDPDWKRINTGLPWSFSDAVNMSIGQGYVQVTPLQVARMFAAVANGGTLYRPQIVQQTGILGEAPSYTMQPDAMMNINIRPEVLEVVQQGLCNVTALQSGTAEFQFRNDDQLQSLGVCGKTGTAQDPPRPVTHAWFAAFAPRDNPEVAIAVIIENGGEGSGVAAPLVRDVLHYYFFDWPGR